MGRDNSHLLEVGSCPHCGRVIPWGHARAKHVECCRRRPSEDQIKAMRAEGLTYVQMAQRVGVSIYMIRRWMQEEDWVPKARRQMELCPELAPLMRQSNRCALMCERCVMLVECRERVQVGLWILCEAPWREEVEIYGWLVWVTYWWRLICLSSNNGTYMHCRTGVSEGAGAGSASADRTCAIRAG